MRYDCEIILIQKGLNILPKTIWRKKNENYFLYRIYSITFSRYFVFDAIKLILLESIVTKVSIVVQGLIASSILVIS